MTLCFVDKSSSDYPVTRRQTQEERVTTFDLGLRSEVEPAECETGVPTLDGNNPRGTVML